MSELSQVVRLVRIADKLERRGESGDPAAEIAWEAARRANAEIPYRGVPIVEIISMALVASPQLDELSPGWFSLEEFPTAALPLVEAPVLSEPITYEPLSLAERAGRLWESVAAGFRALAGEADRPRADQREAARLGLGDILGTAVSVLLTGPQVESVDVSLIPTSEEATRAIYREAATRLLGGEPIDTSQMSPADRERREGYAKSVRQHGSYFEHGLLDWVGE